MFTERRFAAGSVTLNVAVGPENGPPLVLFHGVTRTWQDYLPLVPALVPRWQLYAVDHRGHGLSDRTPGNYLVRDYVADGIEFIKAHVPGQVVVYGHSLGAMVAAAVAAALPERVRAVVLEDPPFETMGRRIRENHFQAFFTGVREIATAANLSVAERAARLAEMQVPTPAGFVVRLGDVRDGAALRFNARCLASLDPAAFDPITEGTWLEGYDIATISRGVRCPALLLQADWALGGMLPDEDAKRFASTAADCVHVRVPGVGHLIHSAATEATLRLVLPFVESL